MRHGLGVGHRHGGRRGLIGTSRHDAAVLGEPHVDGACVRHGHATHWRVGLATVRALRPGGIVGWLAVF